MHVVIAKVTEILFDGEARAVTLPGADGQMTVLSRHMPLITTLKKGEIVVHADTDKTIPVESGVLEVRPDGATVIL